MRAIALLIFIFSSMHTAHLRARDPGDIAFPMSMSVDGVVASEQCEGLTYCAVQPEGYPQKLFDEMFRDTKILQQPSAVKGRPEVMARGRADPTSDQCQSNVTYTPLYLVREDTNQPWKFVIQVEEKIKQQVRIETCSINKESGELPSCFVELAGEERAVCQQNYMSAHVLTYDVANKEIVTTRTQFPSCCSCALSE